MPTPHLLQFSIALFTGLVASTFVPPVRRSIPKSVEVLFWAGLIVACVLGILSVNEPHARELTTSVVWAVDRIINTFLGLLGAGAVGWLSIHRFVLAKVAVVLFGCDVLALALIRSWREAVAWRPKVRLRDWIELPSLAASTPRPVAPDPLEGVNRRLAAATVNFSIWSRDVMLPRERQRLARAAAAGAVESRARLEALRGAATQAESAARSWYIEAGSPIHGLSTRAVEAVRSTAGARSRVVDIKAWPSAQSIGRYGPPARAQGDEHGPEDHTDRLAS